MGRVATVSPNLQPHVVPVGYRFDGKNIYFMGHNIRNTLKFKNIERNSRVAFVVDELVSTNPWRVRGVEVRGSADIVEIDGQTWIKIRPQRKVSWGF